MQGLLAPAVQVDVEGEGSLVGVASETPASAASGSGTAGGGSGGAGPEAGGAVINTQVAGAWSGGGGTGDASSFPPLARPGGSRNQTATPARKHTRSSTKK